MERRKTRARLAKLSRVETLPAPHFICDGVLSAAELDEALAHWPDSSQLREESPGSGYMICHILSNEETRTFSPELRAYWRHFIDATCLPLIREVMRVYSPWIMQKFGDHVTSAQATTVALTEFSNEKAEVGCHVHVHDPTWLFTNLIHLNDDGPPGSSRGNALFGFDGVSSERDFTDDLYSHLARPARRCGMTVQRQYSFKPGRMFSFFETPLSYHGTPSPPSDFRSTGKRRIIRMHVGAPRSLTQSLYGVPYNEYQKLLYSDGPPSERAVSWIKRDIGNMFAAAEKKASDVSRIDVTAAAPW